MVGEMQEKVDSYMQSIPEKGTGHLFVITPGARGGIQDPLVQRVFSYLESKKHGVVAFDFSYYVNGDEVSPEFTRELYDLHSVFKEMRELYPDKKVHLIGKSLGGIVASRFPHVHEVKDIESITILGYVPGQVDFGQHEVQTHIFQGEHDCFGNAEIVKEDIKRFSITPQITEIPCADHSFRCTKEGEKDHYDEIIKHLSAIY